MPDTPATALPPLKDDALDIARLVRLGEKHQRNAILEDDDRLQAAAAAYKANATGIRDAIQTLQRDIAYDILNHVSPETLAAKRLSIMTLEELWERMEAYTIEYEKRMKAKKLAGREDDDEGEPDPDYSSVT